MNIFEIDERIANFELVMDEETGEVTNFDELDALQMAKEEKIENLALWHKELIAEADAIKAEEKKLADRRKTAEKKADSLKNYLDYVLAGEKFKTPRVAVSYRKSETVNVFDIDKLPDNFKKFKTEVSADKTNIKAYLKQGNILDGVELVVNNNIQIK